MILAVRILLCVVGAILLCLGLFIYEDEEKRIQSRLEDWWVMLDDNRQRAFAWQRKALPRIANAATRFIDYIFGERLLSLRAIAVSIFLPFLFWGTFSCAVYVAEMLFHDGNAGMFLVLPFALAVLGSTLFIKLAQSRIGAIFALIAAFAFLQISLIFGLSQYDYSITAKTLEFTALAFTSFLTDCFTIYFFRRCLRVLNVEFSSKSVVVLLVGLLTYALLCGIPLLAVVKGSQDSPLSEIALIFAMFNGSNFAAFLLVLGVVSMLLLHNLAWPSIQRPLYAIQRNGFLASKKVSIPISLAMLSTGLALKTTWLSPVFEAVKKALGG